MSWDTSILGQCTWILNAPRSNFWWHFVKCPPPLKYANIHAYSNLKHALKIKKFVYRRYVAQFWCVVHPVTCHLMAIHYICINMPCEINYCICKILKAILMWVPLHRVTYVVSLCWAFYFGVFSVSVGVWEHYVGNLTLDLLASHIERKSCHI